MLDSFPLPQSCVLRPAIARDRRQLHRLLCCVQRETAPAPSRLVQVLQGMALGLVMVGLWLLVRYWYAGGSQVGLGLLLLAGTGLAIGWVVWRSLDWFNYWVVESQGQLIACAKLCRDRHYSTLYNVLVAADWRGKGVGSSLISYLAQEATKPLYLACQPSKVGFYARFGFVTISPQQLSLPLRRDLELTHQTDLILLVLCSA